MMWESLALQKISKTINRALQTDRFSLDHLAKLHGKSLVMEVVHTPIHWMVEFETDGIHLKKFHMKDCPTVSISGTPSALLRFSKTQSHTQMLMDKTIKIHGDLETLLELKKIQHHLQIDWEALLAEHIGDFTANRVMQFAKNAKLHFDAHFDSLKKSASDYIYHEIKLMPTQLEVEDFYEQLRDFRRDLEKFARKLN